MDPDPPCTIETVEGVAFSVNVAGAVTTTLSEMLWTVEPLVAVIGMV